MRTHFGDSSCPGRDDRRVHGAKTIEFLLVLTIVLGSASVPGAAADSDEPRVPDSEKRTTPRLSAGEALATWALPDGFNATVFAAEPDIRQPIALAFDERVAPQ